MAEKAEIDLELRIKAIEYVVVEIGKVTLLSAGITPEQARHMREAAREVLLKETFPGFDAAMGDHVSAELADLVDKLLGDIEALVANAYRKGFRPE